MRVAPREVVDTVERALYRRGFAPGAARPAADVVLAALDDGFDALGLLCNELDRLDPRSRAGVATRTGESITVEANGACALHLAPSLLDLLEVSSAVVVHGAGSASLLDIVPAAARARGITVELSTDSGEARLTRTGSCDPSSPRLRASLAVNGDAWSELIRYGSQVLAPASERSRTDAGY